MINSQEAEILPGYRSPKTEFIWFLGLINSNYDLIISFWYLKYSYDIEEYNCCYIYTNHKQTITKIKCTKFFFEIDCWLLNSGCNQLKNINC